MRRSSILLGESEQRCLRAGDRSEPRRIGIERSKREYLVYQKAECRPSCDVPRGSAEIDNGDRDALRALVVDR